MEPVDLNQKRTELLDGAQYAKEGWYQVSRRYRTVARFPPGKDPKQALLEAELKRFKDLKPELRLLNEDSRRSWVERLSPSAAGDQYLRCHAQQDGNWRELTSEQFEAFRAAGGDTYSAAHWRDDPNFNVTLGSYKNAQEFVRLTMNTDAVDTLITLLERAKKAKSFEKTTITIAGKLVEVVIP